MKVVLVISSLSSGGAERVMSIMANYWVEYDWDVSLVTISATDKDFYPLDHRVKRIGLDLLKPSSNIVQTLVNNSSRIVNLHKVFTKLAPQVVISFMDVTNIVALAAGLGCKIPLVVSERVDPAYADLGFFRTFLRRKLYPYAAAIVVQTDQVAAWAREFVAQERITIIHNPLPHYYPDNDEIEFTLPGRTVIAIGRLTAQKGFDLLITAFAAICRDDWNLLILGEGDDRPQLEALIASLDMQRRISLKGRVNNVRQYLHQADLFVLSSRFEGFPNALLEAMSAGLPVISFDCPSGPGEIIHDQIDGLLLPPGDVQALAEAMLGLMTDKNKCSQLGSKALSVGERFSVQKIMLEWEQLIKKVSKNQFLSENENSLNEQR